MCFGRSGAISEGDKSQKKSRKGAKKKTGGKKDAHKTRSILEDIPTAKLPEKPLDISVKKVDEEDTLHGYEHSMSERLFEADPEKETSEEERKMIMGRQYSKGAESNESRTRS
ncbi:unnamed protein product [Bursaphelenchus xylophilus]|uniref:(pine wood nematode) hypothetical protein n=1 Tax=Bursaphelenchus xylophilus TaxID=6326 RepID=A0A1I7RHH0_BURXY|nr:unnamed protein product [Bursaphelenchus xylophilus]CAG9115762.1 unnamed protein product [Bursaphelenchus xylophilus]